MADLPRDQGIVLSTKQTIVVASGTDNKTTTIEINGNIRQIIFVVPDLDSSETSELLLIDEDSYTIYASGEKAESTTHILNVDRLVRGTLTLKVECASAQDAARTHVVKLYYV